MHRTDLMPTLTSCASGTLTLAAAAEAILALSPSWRPIDEAPTDSETRVDIWAINRKTGQGHRYPDCRRAHSKKFWIDSEGKWFTGRYFTDADDDQCYDPGLTDERSIVATHFMLTPPGPDMAR